MEANTAVNAGMSSNTIMIILIALIVVFMALMIYFLIQYKKIARRFDVFMRGRDAASLEGTLSLLLEKVDSIEERDKANKDVLRVFNRNLIGAYQKTGIVKYNAFEGMGGQASFVLALLDLGNNGFLLNVIHSRSSCYTYLKEIKNGQADVVLGNEERTALMQAMKKRDRFFDPDEELLNNEE